MSTPCRGAVLDVREPRLLDDVALAAEVGMTTVRIDVPWADAQPRAGAADGDVFERVQTAAQVARAAGMQTWFRLLQPTVPWWFENDGGFTDDRLTAHWWPRWVELVAERLGDEADGWVPFEAPLGIADRLMPDDPRRQAEVMHTLITSWRDAWRLLRGTAPLITSLDVAVVRPADDTPPARDAARRLDQLRWGVWFQGFTDGVVRIPGRADRELPDLAGSADVIGLALRSDVETCLYRAAEYGLDRPLALTFKPVGSTDAERSAHVTAMWREVHRAAEQLDVTAVLATPFADRDGAAGIVTKDRELRDSGHAFLVD